MSATDRDLTYDGSTVEEWIPIEKVLAELGEVGYSVYVSKHFGHAMHFGSGEGIIAQPEVRFHAD